MSMFGLQTQTDEVSDTKARLQAMLKNQTSEQSSEHSTEATDGPKLTHWERMCKGLEPVRELGDARLTEKLPHISPPDRPKDPMAKKMAMVNWFRQQLADCAPFALRDAQYYFADISDAANPDISVQSKQILDEAIRLFGVTLMEALCAFFIVARFSAKHKRIQHHPKFGVFDAVNVRYIAGINGHQDLLDVPAIITYMDDEETKLNLLVSVWGLRPGEFPLVLPTAELDDYLA